MDIWCPKPKVTRKQQGNRQQWMCVCKYVGGGMSREKTEYAKQYFLKLTKIFHKCTIKVNSSIGHSVLV